MDEGAPRMLSFNAIMTIFMRIVGIQVPIGLFKVSFPLILVIVVIIFALVNRDHAGLSHLFELWLKSALF